MMTPKVLWKPDEIQSHAHAYEQQLNPNSTFTGTPLSRLAGMQRVQVSVARIAPGKDSFAYHAHLLEEEWMYVLSGQGVAEVDGVEHAIGPGDFLGFAAPNVPHLVKNRGTDDLVYLMGGEDHPLDVLDYPKLGKRYLLTRTTEGTEFTELGPASRPFRRRG